MSQNDLVLEYMKEFGPITPVKARQEFGVERLAAVIHRLRNQGHNIVTVDRRSYRNRQYAEYHLVHGPFMPARLATKGPIRYV
jgi:hypothetical protein